MEGWRLLERLVPDALVGWLDPLGVLDPSQVRVLIASTLAWWLALGCTQLLWGVVRRVAHLVGRRRLADAGVGPTRWLGAGLMLTAWVGPGAGLVCLNLWGYWTALIWWSSLGALIFAMLLEAARADLAWLDTATAEVVLRSPTHPRQVQWLRWPVAGLQARTALPRELLRHFGQERRVRLWLTRADRQLGNPPSAGLRG